MRIKEILEKISREVPVNDSSYLIDLVNELGVHSGNKNNSSTKIIVAFIELLNDRPDLKAAFRNYLVCLYSNYDPLSLYTETGIFSGSGFYSEIFQRLSYKILPPLEEKGRTQYLIRQVFHNKSDSKNIESVDVEIWINLIDAIGLNADASFWEVSNRNSMLNALLVLSMRITNIGLEPDIISKLPEMDDLQSPFFGLNREVQNYVDCFKEDPDYINKNDEDYRQILVMCSQCLESVQELHRHKEKYGISIHLAYLMLRLEQHIRRLTNILNLIEQKDKEAFEIVLFAFTKEAIYTESRRYSIRKHLNDNLSLLAYKITEHSSLKGDHYRAVDLSEYYTMFKSALGGGLIVAFIVILKVFIHHAQFPPFEEAFMYSLAYSFGFVLIHFLHLTLATKQPAFTANTIAVSLEGKDKSLMKTVKLIAEISRAQFISLVGNIIIVLPFTFLLGWMYLSFTGHPILSYVESEELMMSQHPWLTGSLFYAAIAGVFLMWSGIIAGYFDNNVIFGRIPERIRQHPFLKSIFSSNQLIRISKYLENNLGIILGNIFLGFFLGYAAMFGKLFGLPFDVRHVTVSAGLFGLTLQTGEYPFNTELILEICLSIVLMGAINLIVSFGLSIYVAARSRSLERSLMKDLSDAIRAYFRAVPMEFFFPPKRNKEEIEKSI